MPVFIAILEPKKPPATEQIVQGIAIGKRILPLISQVIMAVKFEEKLISLVLPTDLINIPRRRALNLTHNFSK